MADYTRTQFISAMNQEKSLTVEAEDGSHTISKPTDDNPLHLYSIDGEAGNTLETVFDWFGYYHSDYGEAVISAK